MARASGSNYDRNARARELGYRNAYEWRIAGGASRGLSRSQARGHARSTEVGARDLRRVLTNIEDNKDRPYYVTTTKDGRTVVITLDPGARPVVNVLPKDSLQSLRDALDRLGIPQPIDTP